MVIFNESLNKVLAFLPSIFSDNVEGVITVLKALGILAVVYITYLVIMVSIGIRKVRQLNRIRKRMEDMDSKIDYLIQERKIQVPDHLKIKPIEPDGVWKRFKTKIRARFDENSGK
jgi:hypothetical protein